MSERQAQIEDEAARRYPEHGREFLTGMTFHSFQRGAAWADANPQPRTITLAQSEAILEAGRTGRYEDHEAALRAAGVEVVDDA